MKRLEPSTTNNTNPEIASVETSTTTIKPQVETTPKRTIAALSRLSPLAASVSNSPIRVAATSAAVPITPDRTIAAASGEHVAQRYLYDFVVSACPTPAHIGDWWQILTATIDESFILTDTIDALLKKHSNLFLTRSGQLNPAYNDLGSAIYDLLVGNQGIYSNVTERGDPNTHALHSRHVAHAVVYERLHSARIKNKDHVHKANQTKATLNSKINLLSQCIKQVEKIIKTSTHEAVVMEDLKQLVKLLDDANTYLSLHRECIAAAINYIPTESKEAVPSIPTISPLVLQLHPRPVKFVTPHKATPTLVKLFESHDSRRSKRHATSSSSSTTVVNGSPAKVVRHDISDGVSAPIDGKALLFASSHLPRSPLKGLVSPTLDLGETLASSLQLTDERREISKRLF